ncbi:MAG: hypothetical protein COB02_14935 [Candidatus Cloacimonadota bacterium]|nr:MAG: hypothetical protein COB02_14935 [Candidatus Cloacimonadota bacterium]
MKQLISSLLLFGLISLSHAVKLQYNYEPNKPLYYELTMENISSFASPDSGRKIVKMSTKLKMKQELIEKSPSGEMKVAMTILKAVQTVNGVEKPFSAGINQTQIVRMMPNGKVLSTLTQVPGQSPDQSAMQMIFPTQSLKAGSTWTQIKDIAEPLPVETRTLYKLTKLSPTSVTISSIMKLKNTGGDTVQAQTKGATVFDHVNKKIISSDADSKFQFEIPLKIPGLLPNNSKIKVTLHMKTKIKLISQDEL